MKTLGGVFAFLMLLVLGGVIALFSAHVILSLAGLYSVPFVEQMTMPQLFGLLYVISVIRLRTNDIEIKDKKDSDSIGDSLLKSFIKILGMALALLCLWGLGFLFHWMFF